jgi:predicted RNase H-like HicB family nuclease
MATYIALLHVDSAGKYCVGFPDFPDQAVAGDTLEQARRMAVEVLATQVGALAKIGLPLPDPSGFDEIMAEPKNRDSFGMAIELGCAAQKMKCICVTVSVPALKCIDQAIEASGGDRSSFLVQAALDKAHHLAQREQGFCAQQIASAYRNRERNARL